MMKKASAALLGTMLLIGSITGAFTSVASAAETNVQATEKPLKISINLAARSLALFKGNEKVRLYPIGPGKTSTPTPTGYYKVRYKEVNPTWTDPSSMVSIPSGPDCPLGYRWIEFNGNYGIHGTNRPDSIGHYVSNGCVRMQEADVEELYDLVDVGVPVEITYNRVVVEKTPDDTVVYYIYPDGYGWQNITVSDVTKWLDGYGVGNFVTDETIAEKIATSDGNPNYVGKVYPLYVNGEKQAHAAVVQDNVTYLPAIDLANAAKVNLGWDEATNTLISSLGKTTGYKKRDTFYCRAEDAKTLFNLTGSIDTKNNYQLNTADGTEKTSADKVTVLTTPENKTTTDNAAKANTPETAVAADKATATTTDSSAKAKSLDEIYAETTKDK